MQYVQRCNYQLFVANLYYTIFYSINFLYLTRLGVVSMP